MFVVVVFSVVVEFVVVLLFAVACSLVVNPLLDVSFVVDDNKFSAIYPVSYTHLTLPTICSV